MRYRQTALGVIWVVLQPLMAAGIFTFVFGRVADLDSQGIPYFPFAFSGMLAWNVFFSTVSKFSSSLVSNSVLVSRIYFPRLVVPLSTMGSTLVDFAVSMVMMVVLWAVTGTWPGWALVLLPVWLVLVVLMAGGLGLMAGALNVRYRDIGYMVPVLLNIGLYATPVVYSLAAVPESARRWLELNPLTGLLEAFRWSLVGTPRPGIGAVVWSAVAAIVLFFAGTVVFNRMERQFADVI